MAISFSLQDRVVLLTGGAGLYGRGLAGELAQTGATLIIASRSREKLEAIAAEEAVKGHRVFAEQLDQGDEASIFALQARIAQRFGALHGLVNNSVLRPMKGALGRRAVCRVDARQRDRRHVDAPRLRQRDGRGRPRQHRQYRQHPGHDRPELRTQRRHQHGRHAARLFFHKGGMLNLTRFYTALYGPQNVRVNCLSPGGFFNHQPESFVTRYAEHTMLNRMADDEDLGGAVIFLLSDASRYITGVNLPVDGGYTAK